MKNRILAMLMAVIMVTSLISLNVSANDTSGGIPAHDNGFDYDAWYMAMLQLYSRKFAITAEAGNGGSISPVGTSEVQYNKSITYTITPDDGYEIENVIVDGKNVGAVSEYTFESVSEKHTIYVAFTEVKSDDTFFESDNPFDDVSVNDWYYDDAMFFYKFACKNDLLWYTSMIGCHAPEFSPDAPVYRETLVTVLWRLEGSPVVGVTRVFSDLGEGYYTGGNAVRWAAANGIVNGYGDGTFGAYDTLTHEQIVAILNRYAVYKGWSENEDGEADDCYTNSDWAETNVYWADVNGMFDGIGSDISDLTKGADHAELAAYLRRFCEKFIAE